MSLPMFLTGCSNPSTEAPAAAPAPGNAPPQGRPRPAEASIANPWEAGSADSFTRYYFDTLMVETRYMDADLPSTKMNLFGETFDTPIMTAALSHQNNQEVKGMVVYAQAAAACNAVHWMGMGEDQELEEIFQPVRFL